MLSLWGLRTSVLLRPIPSLCPMINKVICRQSNGIFYVTPSGLYTVRGFKRLRLFPNMLYSRAVQKAGVMSVCHLDQQLSSRCFILFAILKSSTPYCMIVDLLQCWSEYSLATMSWHVTYLMAANCPKIHLKQFIQKEKKNGSDHDQLTMSWMYMYMYMYMYYVYVIELPNAEVKFNILIIIK